MEKRLEKLVELVKELAGIDSEIHLIQYDCRRLMKDKGVEIAGFVQPTPFDNSIKLFWDKRVVGVIVSETNFIIHEMMHVQQMNEGKLVHLTDGFEWEGGIVDTNTCYDSFPHERDARRRSRLFKKKFKDEIKKFRKENR